MKRATKKAYAEMLDDRWDAYIRAMRRAGAETKVSPRNHEVDWYKDGQFWYEMKCIPAEMHSMMAQFHYYQGTVDALSRLGIEWRRNEDGKHDVF